MGPELCSDTLRVLDEVEDLPSVSSNSEVAQVPVSLMLSNHYCQVYGQPGQEHPGSAGTDVDTLPRSGVPGGPVNWCPPIADSSLFRAFKGLSISSRSGMTVAVEGAGHRAGLRAVDWICSVSARVANCSHLSYWLLGGLPRCLGSSSWKEVSDVNRMVSACSSPFGRAHCALTCSCNPVPSLNLPTLLSNAGDCG